MLKACEQCKFFVIIEVYCGAKMGCQLGKLAASERRGAPSNGGAVVADGPPPATDPRLPLTAKQKYSMVASWKGISRAMEKTGICMFIKWVLFIFSLNVFLMFFLFSYATIVFIYGNKYIVHFHFQMEMSFRAFRNRQFYLWYMKYKVVVTL